MSVENVLEMVEIKLKALSGSTGISEVHFARGPISGTWPQAHFFKSAETLNYRIDYDMAQIQVSVWGLEAEKLIVLSAIEYYKKALVELHETVSLSAGSIEINWSELADSGALPVDDTQLYGEFIRVNFRYRGENLEA